MEGLYINIYIYIWIVLQRMIFVKEKETFFALVYLCKLSFICHYLCVISTDICMYICIYHCCVFVSLCVCVYVHNYVLYAQIFAVRESSKYISCGKVWFRNGLY